MQFPRVKVDTEKFFWSDRSRRFMNPNEMETLIALANSVQAEHIIEFGINEGRTAEKFLAHVPTLKQYTGVDVDSTYTPTKHVQRREVPASPGWMVSIDKRVKTIVRPRGTLELGPDAFDKADMIFIDGDHGWQGVVNDTLLAFQLIKFGGVIAWHDFHDKPTVDVAAALAVIANAVPDVGQHIRHADGTWIAFAYHPK